MWGVGRPSARIGNSNNGEEHLERARVQSVHERSGNGSRTGIPLPGLTEDRLLPGHTNRRRSSPNQGGPCPRRAPAKIGEPARRAPGHPEGGSVNGVERPASD